MGLALTLLLGMILSVFYAYKKEGAAGLIVLGGGVLIVVILALVSTMSDIAVVAVQAVLLIAMIAFAIYCRRK